MDFDNIATRLDMLAVKDDVRRMRRHVIIAMTTTIAIATAALIVALIYALPR